MKAFVFSCAGALALICSPAHAEWRQIGPPGFVTTYVDKDSMTTTDGIVAMSSLIDYEIEHEASNGKQFLSLQSRFEYDCAKQLNRALTLTSYAGRKATGEVVAERKDPTDWVPVKPNTVSRTMWELACEKK